MVLSTPPVHTGATNKKIFGVVRVPSAVVSAKNAIHANPSATVKPLAPSKSAMPPKQAPAEVTTPQKNVMEKSKTPQKDQ